MPVNECTLDGKPGYKWGSSGTCYAYTPGDNASRSAAKKKAIKQAVAIGGGKMPTDRKNELDAETLALVVEVERELDELPTVDLEGVEILAEGGPVFGQGSPPEGDFWTRADLEAMAAANRELASEIKPPNKIGHSEEQRLVGLTSGEMPAIGWLDGTTFRVAERDGKARLLTDVKRVPEKVAQLLRAGGYRTRSVELSRVKSQQNGKTYDWVVTGLAWLGGKLPAVRTLDDVLKLYDDEMAERVRVFSADADDDVDLAAASLAAREVMFLRALAEAASFFRGRADSRPMPTVKLTEEQRRKFADALGVKPDELTDEQVAAAEALLEQPDPKPEPTPEPAPEPAPAPGPDAVRELEETKRRAFEADERSRKLEEELRLERRGNFVDGLIRAGKIEPGQREHLEFMYDASPEKARSYAGTLKVDDDLVRELGADENLDPTVTAEQRRELEDSDYRAEASGRLGIPAGEIV